MKKMKLLKNFLSHIIFAALLSLIIFTTFSCDTVFDKIEEPQEQTQESENEEPAIEIPQGPEYKDKGFIKIKVKQNSTALQQTDETNGSRTILPDIDISNFSNITLTGLKHGTSTTTALGSWANVSALEAAAISLEYGMWTLELRAQNGDFLFTSTRYATITVGQVQSVDFPLSTSETGGGVDFRLNFYDSLMSAQAVTYTLYNSSGTVALDSGTLEIQEAAAGGHRYVRYQRPAGTAGVMMPGFYQIVLNFYGDAGHTILLNSYSEIINIKRGFISKSSDKTIDLNSVYTITYNRDGGTAVDSEGHPVNLQEKYSLHTGAIELPLLEKNGFIFEGWYTTPPNSTTGLFTGTPVPEIPDGTTGNISLYAAFTIELKEGPEINDVFKTWTSASRIVASASAPAAGTANIQYLDTADENVPVWWDSSESCVKYYAAGYTDGVKKLKFRPDSSEAFKDCGFALKILDLSAFESSEVTNMSQMFYGNSGLEIIYVSPSFTTENVTDSSSMFYGCTKLRGERGFTYTSAAADKTYAKIDSAAADGYLWSAPQSEIYTITYNLNGGTNNAANISGYHSGVLPLALASATRTGYDFAGWFESSSFSGSALPAVPAGSSGNKTYYAKWSGSAGTSYTVKHWKQHVDDDEYDEVTADVQSLTGTTDTQTSAAANSYTGFTAQTISQQNIAADGSTVVNVYYNRNLHTVTYAKAAADASDASITLPTDSTQYRYGASVTIDYTAARTGFNFTGWNNGASVYTPGGSITSFTMNDSDVTLTAEWTPASGTAYTVIHHKQQVSGSDYDEVTPHQTFYGTTNTLTNAVANSYTGFTAQTFSQANIEPDGSTVINIYYDRDVHSVTYAGGGASGETISVPASLSNIRYGANVDVDLTTSVTRTGYTFAGWSDGTTTFSNAAGGTTSFTMDTSDVTLTAQWTVNSYSITYAAGSTDSSISLPANSSHDYASTVTPALRTATRAGYIFNGWIYDGVTYGGTSSFTMPAQNITLTAHWTARTDTQYKVRHYQQNINNDLYTEVTADFDTKSDGTTDSYKTPTAKNYTGFTVQTPITPFLVTGNGLAEGAVYYNRNTHSVSYNNGVSGSSITVPSGQASVKYGTSVTPDFTGMGTGASGRTGYTFAGWKYGAATWTSGGGQAPLSMPDSDVTFTAQWTINSYTLTYLPGATGEVTVPAASTHEYNSTFDIDFAASRDYYVFAGWKRGATTYTSTGITTFTMPAEDVELIAQWTPVNYTITYELNGGTNSASNPASYNVESDFELAAPTRTDGDYRFGGWYTDLDDPATQVEGFSPGDHGAITLKAKWLPLYATVDGVKQYTKAETIAAINAKDGTYTITLTGEVTAADLGPSGTTGTILNAIRQKNENEGVNYDATANITLNIPETAGIALTTGNEFFNYCYALVAADLCGLDTSAVTNMTAMFNHCYNLGSVDVSSWNTSSVTSMDTMFNYCRGLSTLDLSSFDTSKVTSMSQMFYYTTSLDTLNLCNFDTRSVTDMISMFQEIGGTHYTTIYASDAFIVRADAYTLNMFKMSKIQGGNGTKHEYSDDSSNSTYARIDGGPSAPGYFTELQYVAKVGNKYCITLDDALDKIENSSGELNIVLGSLATQANIGNYSTSGTIIYAIKNNCGASTVNLSVASGITINFSGSMANMFEGCTKLKSADLRSFNTSSVTGMGSMFNGCTKLESVNLSSFDTHSVTSMTSMFQGCSKLTELDLSSFNLQSVTSMSNMFKSCTQLKHIAFSQNPNTAALRYLNGAFSYCSALTELDLSGFNTSNLEALYEMCRSCTALKYINLSGFECPKVGSFEAMFAYCSNLEILDLRDLAPTVSVTNVALMFVSCDNLRKIFVNTDFVTKVEGATNDVNMFNGCAMLAGEISTTFATAGVTDSSYAKIDGAPSNPGYFSGVTNYARVGDAYYSNKYDTVSAILNSTGDIDVVLYRVTAADIGTPTTSDTIAFAISNSLDASIRLIVDRNSGIVVNDSNTISFSGCENLVYADLRGFDFSSRASLSTLFYGCRDLKSVNLAGNTPSLNNVNYLFSYCTALEEVDISGWNFNVSAPTNLTCSSMFYSCTSLKVIYASYNFPSSVSSATDMFKNCTALKGGAGTEFDASDTNYLSRARIDGGPNNPGYFTYCAP